MKLELPGLCTQAGAWAPAEKAHPAGILPEEGTVIASAAKQSGLPRRSAPRNDALQHRLLLSPHYYPFPQSYPYSNKHEKLTKRSFKDKIFDVSHDL